MPKVTYDMRWDFKDPGEWIRRLEVSDGDRVLLCAVWPSKDGQLSLHSIEVALIGAELEQKLTGEEFIQALYDNKLDWIAERYFEYLMNPHARVLDQISRSMKAIQDDMQKKLEEEFWDKDPRLLNRLLGIEAFLPRSTGFISTKTV